MEITNLEELSKIKHPYCDNLFTIKSDEESYEYETFIEFYNEYCYETGNKELCYRWDVFKNEYRYHIRLFTIFERDREISEHHVLELKESDIEMLTDYLESQIDRIKKMWQPFKF